MKFHERLSGMAGVVYGLFFYIRFEYGVWDMLVLWTGNLMVVLGLILAWRCRKERQGVKNERS